MPKKAKKGGGGRGGGRTEEERLVLLQQRAQAEEETAKKKEEILTLFLREKLQKEEKNTAVNLLKLTDGWRSVLRRARCGELRRDLEVLSRTFERQLDGLDSVVKNLWGELQEAERQAAQVQRAHLQRAERLLALQQRRLDVLQQRWESGLQQLSSTFSSERKQISADYRQQRDDQQGALYAREKLQTSAMTEIHTVYGECIAAYDSTYEQKKMSLSMNTKEPLKQEKQQNQEAVQRSRKESEELSIMSQKTQELRRTTEQDIKTVKRLQEAVIQLRETLSAAKTEGLSVEKDLLAARNQAKRSTHAARDQLTQQETAARKQLTELTVQSAAAAKKLQAAIATGQKLLRVADMCGRLDGEQQEVLSASFPSETLRPETEGPETEGPETEGPETEGPETEGPEKEMLPLMKSINKAELLRGALRRQRDDLSRENQQLKLLLVQHQDAMTLGGGDLDALLAVSRAPTTAVLPDGARRHAVIEAVHVITR
ncbi:dynein regulatory complex subunit 2 [Centropristis striata]|uniref:dynein regulatory complex subunit 2 n=1 Tax=Centropristis striata TaxID=184440 RepID=UPI0027DFBB85|nr:dynein regulatory complex subunit 2 [Centropristis striata]